MEKNALISILTPSYNSSKFLPRLLDSVLNQDYPKVEMIVVDDGSTDNTKTIVEYYKNRFECKGYQLYYVVQENGGQSVAVNTGLKIVKGDYLVWPDSDDFYASSDALSRLVSVLETQQVSVVRCQVQNLLERDLSPTVSCFKTYDKDTIDNVFDDCLYCKNGFWYQPGGYMVRMTDVDKFIPNREIYTEKRAGQNWQMMLPLLYKNKCYTIKDRLYKVVVRESSHSHTSFSSFQRGIEMIDVYERTISNTLNSMPNMSDSDKQYYINSIHLKYLKQKFDFAISKLKKREAKAYYKELKSLTKVAKLDSFKLYSPFLYKILKHIKYRICK